MKMTYSEQLRHPNWQKTRLQVLEKAQFECQICGDRDKTLNVHHKQYIKGRMAWEYDLSNFEALCETCHEDVTKSKQLIDSVIGCVPSVRWQDIADLLIGWAEGWPGIERGAANDYHNVEIGKLSSLMVRAMNFGSVTALQKQLVEWDRKSDLTIVLPKALPPFDECEDFK